ncbi:MULTISPECIES: aspartyl-phosphate phosphatase Spo0E family protein [Paraliobacillus]|uniref:aspartyl-phosphate phosphatase Spo0E family protein n=1 Tax=Paraliobacillus TaxID=200903 RepID=UPI000DD32F19|nr:MULTISPECIES: aspartyl-phosphate phosphatase Spo0E family protein [Paraliobacillus]
MDKDQSYYLLTQIEMLRKRMIEIAILEGFTSEESLLLSRELDRLLNQYEESKEKVI